MGPKETKGAVPRTDATASEISDMTKKGKVSFEVDIMDKLTTSQQPLCRRHPGRHRKETSPSPRSPTQAAYRPNPVTEGDSKCSHQEEPQEPRTEHTLPGSEALQEIEGDGRRDRSGPEDPSTCTALQPFRDDVPTGQNSHW